MINAHIGRDSTKTRERREFRKKKASKTGFIDFILEQLPKEAIKPNTMKRRYVVLGALKRFDSQNFDYETMTETINGQTYIDGKRTKTGNNFFTPILPPAMEVLKKYNYAVPHISNQKANDYLHLIEVACNIHKPMTMHVARHSFATLALSYDIPIEDVGRMLGQKNIRTTQIYAKILKKTIERHACNLASLIK